MPDKDGNFKGIAIPELPWHRPKPPRRPKSGAPRPSVRS